MRVPTFAFLLIAILVLRAAGAATAPESWRPALAAIERRVDAEWKKYGVGGVSIGVVSGDALIYTHCIGYLDAEKSKPAAPDTIYRLASITKQFTALALTITAREGKLRYSDPLLRYVPEARMIEGLPDNGASITLLQLATHTSGLPRTAAARSERRGPLEDWIPAMLAALPGTRMAHEPGVRFAYSNIGYALLGAAITRAAGEPFIDIVERRILAPLQMHSSGFHLTAQQRRRLATGFQLRDDGRTTTIPGVPETDGRYLIPSGSLYSTVEDLARFLSFQLGYGPEAPLTRREREDHYGRIYSGRGDLSYGYGLGVSSSARGGLLIRGHTGLIAGYTSAAFFAPRHGLGVVVLHNGSGGLRPPLLARGILADLAALVEAQEERAAFRAEGID
ncbi:beta-lactamase family protein [bacterium]|nr:beta-lactamase family protein [bacterium]